MDEDKTITISDHLWLIPEGDFYLLRDDAGGETMIEVEEITPLIEALQAIKH